LNNGARLLTTSKARAEIWNGLNVVGACTTAPAVPSFCFMIMPWVNAQAITACSRSYPQASGAPFCIASLRNLPNGCSWSNVPEVSTKYPLFFREGKRAMCAKPTRTAALLLVLALAAVQASARRHVLQPQRASPLLVASSPKRSPFERW
jgi:hypothetical protein